MDVKKTYVLNTLQMRIKYNTNELENYNLKLYQKNEQTKNKFHFCNDVGNPRLPFISLALGIDIFCLLVINTLS